MKKTLATCLCIIFALTATLTGCTEAPKQEAKPESANASQSSETSGAAQEAGELPVVRVAVLDQQTGLAAWYISQQGWDVDAGFKIELQVYSSGAPANEALGARLWDIGCIGAAAVNSIRAYDAKQIAEYYTPSGDINIMARNGSKVMDVKGVNSDYPEIYGDADSVRGATIILPVGSGHHICASKWLSALGLTESDVSIVNMEFAQGYQAFISGEGDFFACSYPYADLLLDDGYQKACVMTDLNVPYYDNVIVSSDFYNKADSKEIMTSFVELILKAGDHFAADTEDYVAQNCEYLALNGKDTSDSETMHVATLKNIFLTSEEAKSHPVGSSLRVIAEFQVQQGSITEDDLSKVEGNIDQTIMDAALKRF